VYFPLQGPRFLLDSSQLLNTLPDLTVASHFEIKMEPQSFYIKKYYQYILYEGRQYVYMGHSRHIYLQ